jgi:hypothetical protein
MKYILASRPRSYNTALPLFEAAERARVRALPLAARRLAYRQSLPSATARMVAEAAGFALEIGR